MVMTMTVTLELTLACSHSQNYVADLRVTSAGSHAPVAPLAAPMPVALDFARLRALTLDPHAYGAALSTMLFARAELSAGFAQARVAAAQQGVPLRLRLALNTDVEEVHQLRWETLADPQASGQPLAASAQVLFSRTLPSPDWQPVRIRSSEALRVTAFVAVPVDVSHYGLAPLDPVQEIGRLRAQLNGCALTVLGQQEPATLPTLFKYLHAGCDLLLVQAHGRADAAGQTWLYLEDETGHTMPVPGRELVSHIATLVEKPRLIILGCCESGGDGCASALAALGPQLVRAGVPAVLAMQGRITLETLNRFLATCLQSLLQDGRIDRAVAIARNQVRDRPDWWVPALWMRTTDGCLWHKPAPPASVVLPAPTGTLTARQRSELLARLAISYRERLANALTHQVRLRLGLHTRPDAVDPSWRRMRMCGPFTSQPVPLGTSLLELFDAQQGQLLVLGLPGAGKTTLLVELAQALLVRAQTDPLARIPVVVNVAAWRSGQSLRDWLTTTLPDWLGASRRFAAQLATSDDLLLLLDGLDEVTEAHRAACVAAINAYLREHDLAPPLVVGCRSREYTDMNSKLQIAAAIELEPLDLAAVERALRCVPGTQGVVAALKVDDLLRELTRTPLIVNVLLLAHGGQDVPQVQVQTVEERRAALGKAYVRRVLEQRVSMPWSNVQGLC